MDPENNTFAVQQHEVCNTHLLRISLSNPSKAYSEMDVVPFIYLFIFKGLLLSCQTSAVTCVNVV